MGTDPRQMSKLTKGLPSKSAKMRALAAAGYERSEIARFLDVSYQFVRNVLVREEARRDKENDGASVAASGGDEALRPTKVRLGPDGRVVIPAPFREALAIKDGDVMIASLEGGEVRLATMAAVARRVQALVRQFVPEGVSLSDELIAERKREAEREKQNG